MTTDIDSELTETTRGIKYKLTLDLGADRVLSKENIDQIYEQLWETLDLLNKSKEIETDHGHKYELQLKRFSVIRDGKDKYEYLKTKIPTLTRVTYSIIKKKIVTLNLEKE